MFKYQFNIENEIQKCEDCPCYYSTYSYNDYGFIHTCFITKEETFGEYDTKYLRSGLTDEEYEIYENEQDKVDENCRVDLFKQCPLKPIKE